MLKLTSVSGMTCCLSDGSLWESAVADSVWVGIGPTCASDEQHWSITRWRIHTEWVKLVGGSFVFAFGLGLPDNQILQHVGDVICYIPTHINTSCDIIPATIGKSVSQLLTLWVRQKSSLFVIMSNSKRLSKASWEETRCCNRPCGKSCFWQTIRGGCMSIIQKSTAGKSPLFNPLNLEVLNQFAFSIQGFT